MPHTTLPISFLSLILLLFLSPLILSPPIFVTATSPPCPSPPFTPPQHEQQPADSRPLSIPRPTYAPRSGRSLTRCQGAIPEMKVSAYLDLALTCLTNTTFEHEHVCVESLCDAVLLHVPDNPGVIGRYLREAVVREEKEEEEAEGRARDRDGETQDYKRGNGGYQNPQEDDGRSGIPGGTMTPIPSLDTSLWLRCSHIYLPPHLLTTMSREHARQRRNRLILLTLLTLALLILLITLILRIHTRRPQLLVREPLEFADEGIDAARLKRYLLRTRTYLRVSPGWARWVGCEGGRVGLPWLDRLGWVRRRDVLREDWFRGLEVGFKAKRGRQG